MNKSIEQSIKDKVKKIAKDQNREFGDVWLLVLLERWMARLHASKYKDRFIFKGGLCLDQYLAIHRETKDLDFLVQKLSASRENLANVFEEIATIDMQDGIKFIAIKVGDLAHAHMKYPGFEVSMRAELGQSRTPLHIDIGVGDVVKAENLTVHLSQYKETPLFEKEIQLWAYPVETIFAEKLETAIKRDSLNSRMKDYHDLALLVQSDLLDADKAKNCVRETFRHRGTKLNLIPTFEGRDLERLENLWKSHLGKVKRANPNIALPQTISEVVTQINEWMSSNIL